MSDRLPPTVKTSLFLPVWHERNRETYESQGKVTSRKLEAIFQMLFYGAKSCDRLSKVAKLAQVALASVRVWRTETPFRELYRQVVWDCADAFVETLLDTCPVDAAGQEGAHEFVDEQIESFKDMGSALQHAVLWRLVVDVLHLWTAPPLFIDRIDMLGEVSYIGTSRPTLRLKTERKGIEQTVLSFVWRAVGTLHSSRAKTRKQQQRHFAVMMLLGFKLAQAAYRSIGSSPSASDALLPFLSGPTDLEAMEATFNKLYPWPFDGEDEGE